jgi:hypothetical protein
VVGKPYNPFASARAEKNVTSVGAVCIAMRLLAYSKWTIANFGP